MPSRRLTLCSGLIGRHNYSFSYPRGDHPTPILHKHHAADRIMPTLAEHRGLPGRRPDSHVFLAEEIDGPKGAGRQPNRANDRINRPPPPSARSRNVGDLRVPSILHHAGGRREIWRLLNQDAAASVGGMYSNAHKLIRLQLLFLKFGDRQNAFDDGERERGFPDRPSPC